jgi:methyl coenzyme M reductase subunit D
MQWQINGTMNKHLIEQLSTGTIQIEHNPKEDPEFINKILREAFPCDGSPTAGKGRFYKAQYSSIDDITYWIPSSTKFPKITSVKESKFR